MPKLATSNKLSEFYTSPFEALPIDEALKGPEIDRPVLRGAKNRLLAEIQFNEGKIPWLNNRVIEKSKAEAYVDELSDPQRSRYHWYVYQNKPLLRFLTRGDLEHFIYSEENFPLATLQLLDKDHEFSRFLSKPLARQYNVVLTWAIEQRLLPLVEIILDGRRWVLPEDEEACFEGAHRRIGDLVEQVRTLAAQSQSRKVTIDEIKALFVLYQLPDLLNLLPSSFSSELTAFVKQLRQLAITCFNHHQDAELANEILKLCRQFQCNDARLIDRLEEDLQSMGQEVADSRLHSFSALIRPNLSAQIGNGRITYGQASLEASQLEAVSWGVVIHRVNGSETNRAFSLVVRDAHTCLAVEWNTPGIVAAFKGLFRPAGEKVPVTELASSEQEAHYNKMIDAVQHHLAPSLVAKLIKRVRGGQGISIGPCYLTQLGIGFKTGLIFHKSHSLLWKDAKATMSGGQLEIASLTNPAIKISMPLKETDNAVILPVICFAMQKQPV